jgi:hypothetical protein
MKVPSLILGLPLAAQAAAIGKHRVLRLEVTFVVLT